MRIAYLVGAPGIPVQGPTGASAHVRGVVRGLREQHEVTLYAVQEADQRGRFGDEVPATVTGPSRLPAPLRRWPELAEITAARRLAGRVLRDAWDGAPYDLVIERHTLFSDAGWRVHDRLGVPWVLEVDAPPSLERRRFETLPRPERAAEWERRVLLAAPLVIAVSRWLSDWLRSEVGCRHVKWVPNGVEPHKGDRARGRQRLGVAADEPVVGFVGSFKPWHDMGTLIRVASVCNARLALVGDLPEEIRRVMPEDTLTPGHLPPAELAHVVAALDVGLAPYPADAPPWFCPLKILDYRAQGTPVVASYTNEAALLVARGGTVVPPGDVDGMIDAAREWMGRRCKALVRSWRTVGKQMLAAAGFPAEDARPQAQR